MIEVCTPKRFAVAAVLAGVAVHQAAHLYKERVYHYQKFSFNFMNGIGDGKKDYTTVHPADLPAELEALASRISRSMPKRSSYPTTQAWEYAIASKLGMPMTRFNSNIPIHCKVAFAYFLKAGTWEWLNGKCLPTESDVYRRLSEVESQQYTKLF